ncbi:MAG: clan AA aspartic protease [Bacteroidetes bacterium]|nr:clan AA aspartic protease [Bacteroidota bacterium]
MKKGYFLFIFFTVASCNTVFITKSAIITSKAHVSILGEKQVLPYEDVFRTIVLTVKIKGQPYRFIFDTGAGGTVISKELAKALNLETEGGIATSDAHGIVQKLSVGYIDTMFLGKIAYTHVGVLVSDFNKGAIFSCFKNIDGILGTNVIKLNNWQINFDSATVSVFDINAPLPTQNTKSVPFSMINRTPFVDFSLNGAKERFMIDMGKTGGISVSPQTKLHLTPFATMVGYSAFGAFGGAFDTTQMYKTTLSNPTLTVSNETITQSKKLGSLIGKVFLETRCSSVIFDFKNKSLFLNERPQKENKHSSYGFSCAPLGNVLILSTKLLHFSDEVDQLNIGDTIKEINNASANPCDMFTELSRAQKNKETILLKFSNNKTLSLSPKPF